ncbi:MAG: hypothetical protein JF626_04600 [Polaromonas sp.]|nr:hypothetical protein [Polaromonas sp.]
MVKLGVSMERSPPVNESRSMSMAELLAQFRKFPLKALLHILLLAGPLRSNRL